MARCAMRSGNAVVKCAQSAPAQTDFGFTCSVPFGALHFFCFSYFNGQVTPQEACV